MSVLDEELLAEVDRVARKAHASRSAFIRDSVTQTLGALRMREQVEAERRAYLRRPQTADERAAFRAFSERNGQEGPLVKRGEVHWYRFRAPDKRRPVVVLTRSDLIGHLGTVTVAAVTSTVREVASEVSLGISDGLSRPCAISLHNVFTLPKAETGPYLAGQGIPPSTPYRSTDCADVITTRPSTEPSSTTGR